MDARKMLKELLEERQLIDATIGSIARLAAGTRRRGRPPKAVTEARNASGKHASAPKRKDSKRESPAGSAAKTG